MITGQGEIERLGPGLLGALRSRAAALDEPGHSKTRNAVNLRAPQDKFYPRRARRNRRAALSVTARSHRSWLSKHW